VINSITNVGRLV